MSTLAETLMEPACAEHLLPPHHLVAVVTHDAGGVAERSQDVIYARFARMLEGWRALTRAKAGGCLVGPLYSYTVFPRH